MDEYISRKEVEQCICKQVSRTIPTVNDVLAKLIGEINEISAVNVVVAVRCADCACCEWKNKMSNYGWCKKLSKSVMHNEYCSWGWKE